MCGITGILNLDGKKPSAICLKRMTDAIAHRGPDGEGFYINGPVGMGHRRLAIIDLSPAGSQPMLSVDGRYVIVYNGEVYNFRELRLELEKIGYIFKSKTDAEVVLCAYVQWGEKCLDKFNGMFAFAVWDRKEKELFLARDRYGIKPLYYSFHGKEFIFASEQKAILSYPRFRRNIDPEALLEYFTFQNIFTDKTLIRGIRLFLPGSWAKLKLNRATNQLKPVRYWDFNFRQPQNLCLKEKSQYPQKLQYLFEQALSRQLVSDVEVGSYLSGGIDSSFITAVASKYLNPLKTFCIGFDCSSASGMELSFDERKKAKYISSLYQTEHHEMVLKSGDMRRCMQDLIWALEDLRLGQSYPNFYASKLASRFVKVCFSGAGGDELFAGYPWRYYRAFQNKSFQEYIDDYYVYWHRLIPNSLLKKVFSPIWQDVKNVYTLDIFKDVFSNCRQPPRTTEEYINHSLYFEAKTFLQGLFIVEDKLSMINSLEVRVPFMDNDLVDFASEIPVSLKLNNLNKIRTIDENEFGKKEKYFKKSRDGKIILRKVLKKYTGTKLINQNKQGFVGPDASWYRGESIDYVKDLLLDKKANIYSYFDYQATRDIISEHLEHKHNRRLFIWSLLCFECWLKIFLLKDNIGED